MTDFQRPAGRAERRLRAGTALATLCVLAACGGGGGDGVTRGPTPTPVDTTYNIPAGEVRNYQDTTPGGDAGGAIAAGETLTARSVGSSALRLDYDADTTAPAGRPQVAVTRNASGALTLIVDGDEQYAFTDADRVGNAGGDFGFETYGPGGPCEVSNECVAIYSYTGPIDDLLSGGNGYAEVVGYQTNIDSGVPGERRGFAVFGLETREAALAALPSATYSGRAGIEAFSSTGFDGVSTSRTAVRGDLAMAANFGSGTISGEVTNLEIEEGFAGYDPLAGSLVMEQTRFDVNGFQGNLAAGPGYTVTNPALLASATYSGAFYGPEADEVGGTISGSGGGANAVGYFLGYRD